MYSKQYSNFDIIDFRITFPVCVGELTFCHFPKIK